MKKKFVYVLFACLAMVNMALGQQNESRLALNPEVPVAGQSLELTYNPKGGPLEGTLKSSEDIDAYFDSL